VTDGERREAAHYRRAAQEALKQVDFCAEYLRRIQKGQLAARLSRNSDYIRRKFLREPARSGRRRESG
jgi:hypothetical protein